MIAMMSTAALGATPVYAGEAHVHWGYQGHTGPDQWARLSDDFATCAAGKRQSPIDIRKTLQVHARQLHDIRLVVDQQDQFT